jgi:probable HAF family extracellular repeat protein
MTTGKLLATAGILLALLSLSFLPATAQSYTVTDLGSLGGKNSYAYAINDNGQVAGYAQLSGNAGPSDAFFWSNSTGMVDLGWLHSFDDISMAFGINKAGTVVGMSGGYAFLWTQNAGMQDLGNLGGFGSVATAINSSGQVVGSSGLSNGSSHAFLWTATSGMQDLGSLGGNSQALAINDAGQVVGVSWLSDNITDHAFLWTATGGMQDLGTLGGPDSVANGINAAGQIVGWSLTSTNSQVAFLWDSKHGMQSLGTAVQGGSGAQGINSSGQVVGVLLKGAGAGFLWTKADKLQNLNSFISHQNGYVTQATAINRSGQIAGRGGFVSVHAWLLTPSSK